MKNIVKSNKISGLEKLIAAGAKVPAFTIIPDYEDLDIDYCALNPKYKISKMIKYIEDSLKEIGESEYGYSLRSASFDEDDSEISAAGRYTSYNALKSLDQIYYAAVYIWKHHRNNAKMGIKCPLILQKTHCSYFSGVYFKDTSDNKNISVIESYYGSCRSIVEGMVLPYRSTLIDGKWKHEFSSEKDACYKFYSHRGLFEEAPDQITDGKLLTVKQCPFPSQVRNYIQTGESEMLVYGYRPASPPKWYDSKICNKLESISKNLEDGKGVDIEWGTDSNGTIVFYQYRPLTRPLSPVPVVTQIEYSAKGTPLSGEYRGMPASPGIATGLVLFKRISSECDSILMLNEAQVNDVSLVANSAGVISELGGMLSHLAIVCRELKKPCIVGIQNLIPENTIVEMDGKTGIIKIIENKK